MDQTAALNTLIQAAQVATKRGAFELVETESILAAIKVFTKKPEDPKETTPEELKEVLKDKKK
jgi:hypothetical protein